MKKYFMVCDTETSSDGMVKDFAAVIVDRKGNIAQTPSGRDAVIACFIRETAGIPFWSNGLACWKAERYNGLKRPTYTVAQVNQWLARAIAQFAPILTAYNLNFDRKACNATDIALECHASFCLWHAAAKIIGETKAYRNHCIEHGYINVTEKRNMVFQTNAQVMAHYVKGAFAIEPHTALEDIVGFEVPILVRVVRDARFMEKVIPYEWQRHDARKFLKAK